MFERYICTLRKAGNIAANERGAFDAGGELPIHSGDRSREIIQILWPAEQTLVARASCEKVRADIDAGGLATADRRLDFTPNPALSLRVRLGVTGTAPLVWLLKARRACCLGEANDRAGRRNRRYRPSLLERSVLWPERRCLALELLSLRGCREPSWPENLVRIFSMS